MDKSNHVSGPVRLHHRSRIFQVPIYFGKLVRSFIYQSDWKFLPMAAIIAAMLSMVVRKKFFITMEGTLMGAFGLTCVAIWNGFFNSIQSICRERAIIKREHRSGMHISAYLFSHMLYQACICLAEAALTVYVCKVCGIQFPDKGFMTPFMMLDIGITFFLITYAADMLSLLISSISHTTTGAMTVMPFLLIFQLVFSGGVFNLPAWANSLTPFTLSNYGLKCMAAQADYNGQPLYAGWNVLEKLRDQEVKLDLNAGELIDRFNNSSINAVAELRDKPIIEDLTLGKILDALSAENATENIMELRATSTQLKFTIGELIDAYGEEQLKELVLTRSAEASYNANYAQTTENVTQCWICLAGLGAAAAFLALIALEFIDKDKR